MKRHKRNLRAYYYVKEASLKVLHIIRFQLTRHSGKGKSMEMVQRSVVVSGRGEGEQAEHRGFLAKGKYSLDIIMMGTCHYTFV